jgi:hypothetical protein
MPDVSEHLSVPAEEHDMKWLEGALQSAIELEHATLPLYLGAMLSLEVQSYTTYNLLRSVAMEEMVHMAIACNTLAAIGGTPKIGSLTAPSPGCGLPGGAEPDLEVVLAPLSKLQIQNFMRLEIPAFLLPDEYKKEQYPSIATLYGAIKAAVMRNAGAVRSAVKTGGHGNQIGDDIGFTTITYADGTDPVEQIVAGIDEIIQQGEGASSRTLHAEDFQGEESHYCKFAEIFYGARYQVPEPPIELNRETESQFFRGYPIAWPVVVNTLAVPSDGYAKILGLDPNGADVKRQLEKFDQAYTDILTDLDAMWNGPANTSWPTFGKAVGSMGDLRVLSCFAFMRNQIPPEVVGGLAELYPEEHERMARYTDLDRPVFYGPRFHNTSL